MVYSIRIITKIKKNYKFFTIVVFFITKYYKMGMPNTSGHPQQFTPYYNIIPLK